MKYRSVFSKLIAESSSFIGIAAEDTLPPFRGFAIRTGFNYD